MAIANILMVFVSIAVAKVFAKILSIPYSILGPTIIMLGPPLVPMPPRAPLWTFS